ncbi:RNA 2'-phosphotransferase [Arsenicibacter rosenii]|uniref:RNA 2'-phosphotransferase n=1 Tax=Arsenicibacter rosenii TaxID=1750698 RepID=UPI000ACC7A45|nr:RNA 2'-phosphotransferase [Arsenicibacter rosenii]
MLTASESIKISKFLSLVLRHKPQAIGITLDENGVWLTDHIPPAYLSINGNFQAGW